jgi:CTP:molybdopterin cytidylyltransferase MocA
MESDSNLHVLVLAAGAASRFGSPKQLARIGGVMMLQKAVSQAAEVAGHAVTVVLGAHAERIAPMLRHSPATVEINRHWQEGLASSLRLGISRLPAGAEGVLVTLADQVAISAFDLRRLVSAWRRQPDWMIAASYNGHIGVPAVFPVWSFADLAALRGDAGARMVLARHADRCLPMPNASIDIDTPEDLLSLEVGDEKGVRR